MNIPFTLDRESFQNLLARASLAQEYLDSQKAKCPAVDVPPEPAIGKQPKEAIPVDYIQSLSTIVAVQRLIATDDVDVDGAMALIADQARNVANADGVAIGLLEGDNLVYRAGSGGAAAYIGRYVKATLSVADASGEVGAFTHAAAVAAMIAQAAKGVLSRQYQWKPAAVVIVLVMAGWIAYTHRGPASPVSTSELSRSNAIEEHVPFAPAKPAANRTSKPQTAPVATQKKKKTAGTTSQRPRVWRDVDYIAEDVTVRYVTLKPAVAPQKRPAG